MDDEQKRQKAIDRVAKCLRLASNAGTEEEAHAALLRAQQLMYAHGIAESEVRSEEGRGTDRPVLVAESAWIRRDLWVDLLFGVIADNFRCRGLVRCDRDRAQFLFLGYAADVEAACAAFSAAEGAARALAAKHTKQRADDGLRLPWRRPDEWERQVSENYLQGFAIGLQAAFNRQVATMGLMVITDQLVTACWEEATGGREAEPVASTIAEDSASMYAGYRDGQAFGDTQKRLEAETKGETK